MSDCQHVGSGHGGTFIFIHSVIHVLFASIVSAVVTVIKKENIIETNGRLKGGKTHSEI